MTRRIVVESRQAEAPLSAIAAQCFWDRSSIARENGAAGAAACALLACKLHEAARLFGAVTRM